MKFAYFPGCKIPYHLPQYDQSVRAVLNVLGVELVDVEFNCCGYPVRHLSFEASVLSGARNMALARKLGYPILTPCMCCYGNLRHAEYWLRRNENLKRETNSILSPEGLQWEDGAPTRHLLSVLAEDVGLEHIGSKVSRSFDGLNVAAHYGCHALRPSEVVQLDNPLSPTLFERLIHVTGAQSIRWGKRLDCCGHPLWGKNDRLSLELMHRKIEDADHCGADIICTACTYCQIQFDSVRAGFTNDKKWIKRLPAILYSQLLGLSFAIDATRLGIDPDKIESLNSELVH